MFLVFLVLVSSVFSTFWFFVLVLEAFSLVLFPQCITAQKEVKYMKSEQEHLYEIELSPNYLKVCYLCSSKLPLILVLQKIVFCVFYLFLLFPKKDSFQCHAIGRTEITIRKCSKKFVNCIYVNNPGNIYL